MSISLIPIPLGNFHFLPTFALNWSQELSVCQKRDAAISAHTINHYLNLMFRFPTAALISPLSAKKAIWALRQTIRNAHIQEGCIRINGWSKKTISMEVQSTSSIEQSWVRWETCSPENWLCWNIFSLSKIETSSGAHLSTWQGVLLIAITSWQLTRTTDIQFWRGII